MNNNENLNENLKITIEYPDLKGGTFQNEIEAAIFLHNDFKKRFEREEKI